MDYTQEKKRAALTSIFSNTGLIICKFIVGIMSGSVSIISEAIHSLSDLVASFIAFFAVSKSSQPADNEHEFGHGKFEDLSGLIEGLLILIAALYIIYESVMKLRHGVNAELQTSAGILVMLISVVVNIFVSRHLFKVGHKTQSLALIADGEHLRTDIYTSAGILAALVIIRFTGFTILDPIIAIGVAFLILKTAIELCLTATKSLLDESLPEEEKIAIKTVVNNYIPDRILDIDSIKTRRSGAEKIIELTLRICEKITIKEGHSLCDEIEEDLSKNIGNTKATIHLEPCCYDCGRCCKNN